MIPKSKKSSITNKKPQRPQKITTKIASLNAINKKSMDMISVSSTSRNFLRESNRNNDKMESTSSIIEKAKDVMASRNGKKPVKFKIMARQKELSFFIDDEIGEMTVSRFKQKFLDDYLEDGLYGARMIWNGRELRNSHQMKEFGLEDNPMVYVFLFNIQDRDFETRKVTTLKTDPNLGVDFDYFVERNALSEEEVAWKRFCYHAPYIYRTKLSKISDYYLFMREIDYMNSNKELKRDKQKFKGIRLKEIPEFDRNITPGRKIALYLLLIVLGLIFGPLALPLIKLSLSQKMRYTVVLATMVYAFILITWKKVFSIGIISPLQIIFL